MNNMLNRITAAFENEFFSVDNGAILTSCTITEDGIECSETNESGETWEVFFPVENISNAIIEGECVYITDAEQNECIIRFYKSEPLNI
jgi:hypothetical protein